MDQLPRLGKRELICLLLFTCNHVVFVWRGFLFLWMLGMGYVILLWHPLSLPYNYFKEGEWKAIHIFPFRVTSYSALQWFQISIDHNILVTNKLLQQMKIKDDALCTFCHSNNESIVHLFWQCSKIQQFIRSVSAWLSAYGIDCNISEKYFIFGWQEG